MCISSRRVNLNKISAFAILLLLTIFFLTCSLALVLVDDHSGKEIDTCTILPKYFLLRVYNSSCFFSAIQRRIKIFYEYLQLNRN